MKRYQLVSLLVLVSLWPLIFGLAVACKKTLEAGGAYAPVVITTNATTGGLVTNTVVLPDLGFFQTDSAFRAGYASLDSLFTWERDNRLFLWGVSPKIKHTMDGIRPTAVQVVRDYAVAREAYKASPTPAGLSTLSTILAKLQQLQAAAAAVSTNLSALK
jgi:hypothetical protein